MTNVHGLRAAVAVVVTLSLTPSVARAIPAFARAYAVPCSTCHDTIPVRNDFGEVFRRNGYRWPGDLTVDAEAHKPPPVDMLGIGALDAKFPAAIPIALVGTFGATYSNDKELVRPVSFGSPSLKIMLGSALGEHTAVFGEWSGGSSTARLFLHLTRLLNHRELNIIVGRFEPTTTLLRNNDSYFDTFVLSGSSLNGHVLGQSRNGVELNGAIFGRGFYAIGMVQNSGSDSNFDAYYHASYKFGGANGNGEYADVDLDQTSWLDDVVLEFAQWGYLGLSGDDSTPGYELARLGGDIKLMLRGFRARTGLMIGQDTDRRVNLHSVSVTSTSEASYALTSWLRAAAQVDVQDTASQSKIFTQYQAGVLALLLENVRLRLAASYNTDHSFATTLQILAGI